MVVAYFLVASVATRRPIGNKEELILIGTVFVMYLLWDMAASIQKKPGSEYEKAWTLHRAFRLEMDQWKP
jgi:hypothetical protein